MNQEILSGMLLDEWCSLTLDELSQACRVRTEWIVELVEEGILEPRGRETSAWCFAGSSLQRVRTVIRLQRDLGVNLAGAALVLDLVDEVAGLRARLRRLDR